MKTSRYRFPLSDMTSILEDLELEEFSRVPLRKDRIFPFTREMVNMKNARLESSLHIRDLQEFLSRMPMLVILW